MRAKRDILEEQHQLERNQQPNINNLTTSQLQEMKPVLLQQLYDHRRPSPAYSNPFEDTPQYTPSNHNDTLVNIRDDSERDATIIHTEQQLNNTGSNSRR